MRKFTNYRFIFIIFGVLLSCNTSQKRDEDKTITSQSIEAPINWNNEIIYHVMQRSFYDSNGDLHGDLNGFTQKLDYLKELGVTTILFTPLYESGFYHNYFPTDYKNIDQEYGTKEDYLNFVTAVHEKGLKFIMDMETQYAQSGNIWFDDSYQNPGSEYSDFIYYADSLNQHPEQIFMPPKSPMHDFVAWPGNKYNIVLLDLNHPRVKQWMIDFYSYWVDPNKDGNFDDGVDGFRIDHIMDDLDYKGIFTNLYQDFWQPIFTACKEINPNLFVLGEQSNWNEYGDQMIRQSGADAAFSFPLRFAIAGEEGTHDMYIDPSSTGVTMESGRIHAVVLENLTKFSDSTFTVNFLENHDTDRWATVVNGNENQKRSAAILNLLLPGVPSIYYGQELGVTGQKHEWGSDANHIPVREAFPWTSNSEDPGNALWYKDSGEVWEVSFWKSDVIHQFSLKHQKQDPGSLWQHYKKLIALRTNYDSFRLGDYLPLYENMEGLIAFQRTYGEEKAVVIINTSADTREVQMNTEDYMELYGQGVEVSTTKLQLAPFSFYIALNKTD